MNKDIQDNLSVKSKRGVHTLKICAYCGKQEAKHWSDHCKEKHGGNKIVWDGKSELRGTPWCSNWKEVHVGAKAENIHPSFKAGFKKGNSFHKQRSTAGSVKATSVKDNSSNQTQSEYNDS